MPNPLKQTLAALAQLSPGDRNAILRKLSPEQRERLATLSTQPQAPATKMPPKPALPQCSPWLAKRLVQLSEEKNGAATDATRQALRAILAGDAR